MEKNRKAPRQKPTPNSMVKTNQSADDKDKIRPDKDKVPIEESPILDWRELSVWANKEMHGETWK